MPRNVSEDWTTLLCLWAVKSLGTTRAENRSLLSGGTTHHSLGTQRVCRYCRGIQEDGATVHYSGTNPERPRFTPYLSSTAVLQGLRLRPSPRRKPPSTACPAQGQAGRFTDGVSPAGSGQQLCTEASPTGEAGDMKGVGTLVRCRDCRSRPLRLFAVPRALITLCLHRKGTGWQPQPGPFLPLP